MGGFFLGKTASLKQCSSSHILTFQWHLGASESLSYPVDAGKAPRDFLVSVIPFLLLFFSLGMCAEKRWVSSSKENYKV